MLLERLVEKSEEDLGFDWDTYYRWLYSELAGREVTDMRFWICRNCLTVNEYFLPARYGKCRECKLIFMA